MNERWTYIALLSRIRRLPKCTTTKNRATPAVLAEQSLPLMQNTWCGAVTNIHCWAIDYTPRKRTKVAGKGKTTLTIITLKTVFLTPVEYNSNGCCALCSPFSYTFQWDVVGITWWWAATHSKLWLPHNKVDLLLKRLGKRNGEGQGGEGAGWDGRWISS